MNDEVQKKASNDKEPLMNFQDDYIGSEHRDVKENDLDGKF